MSEEESDVEYYLGDCKDYTAYCLYCKKETGWAVFTLDRSKCMECDRE